MTSQKENLISNNIYREYTWVDTTRKHANKNEVFEAIVTGKAEKT